jgi:hypothetical protein
VRSVRHRPRLPIALEITPYHVWGAPIDSLSVEDLRELVQDGSPGWGRVSPSTLPTRTWGCGRT